MKINTKIIAIISLLISLFGCQKPSFEPADTLFTHGKIYTADNNHSWAEAIAIKDEKIVYVGDNKGAKNYLGDKTISHHLQGKFMMPGIHDSHNHLLTGGIFTTQCDLMELTSIPAIKERLSECSKHPGWGSNKWILGGGWDNVLFPNGDPGKTILDELFSNRPVYMESIDGHSAWVNSKALSLAGINNNTPNPPQGIIERDLKTGEATGTLRNWAMKLVKDITPEPTDEERTEALKAAIKLAHQYGITSVIEPGLDRVLIQPYLNLANNNQLNIRILASLSTINWQPGTFDKNIYQFLADMKQYQSTNFNVNSVKIYTDGVLETGTAALLEPYIENDHVHGTGPKFYNDTDFNDYISRFDKEGYQVHVHAIGDAGVRQALNAFENALKDNGNTDNRHHIVHLQLVDKTDIPRFGKLGVAANFQAQWAWPEPWIVDMALPLVGQDRVNRMYPIGSIHKSDGMIVGGSDWFVTNMNPFPSIEAAIRRQDPSKVDGDILNKNEQVDLTTMIDAYTINGE